MYSYAELLRTRNNYLGLCYIHRFGQPLNHTVRWQPVWSLINCVQTSQFDLVKNLSLLLWRRSFLAFCCFHCRRCLFQNKGRDSRYSDACFCCVCNSKQWKSVKCSPLLAFSWSSSFAFSSGFDKNVFIDSHGSLPAPVGNDCGGLFRSDDTVPCERFTISLAKNATETVRFWRSQLLISLATVDGLSPVSCGDSSTSSLASRHKDSEDFSIRIRTASQQTIMGEISVFLPKSNWTYLHKPCPHILRGTVKVVLFMFWYFHSDLQRRNSTPWVGL